MKRIKTFLLLMLILVVGSAFSACAKDEVSLLMEYEKIGVTEDANPIFYVQISMIVTDTESGIEFNASDFSVVRNGVKENGTVFITGFEYNKVIINGKEESVYVSITKPTYKIENNEAAGLKVVFTGTDNLTELYYKNQKIALTK